MPDQVTTTLVCPNCGAGTMLVAVDRNGVVVDACPRCRGIWLDRGELDKLIELEASASSSDFLDEVGGRSRERDEGDGHGQGSGGKKRRRGSFLGEMFDFG